MKNCDLGRFISSLFGILFCCVMVIHHAFAQTSGLSTVVQQGHKVSIQSLAYAPNGEMFVSHSYTDHSLMIWSKTGLLIKSIPLNYASDIEFTPDSKFLMAKEAIYDLNGQKILELSPGQNNGVSCSKISPDGKIIALGLDNTNIPDKRKIRIIDRQGNIVRLINGTNHTPRCMSFSPDGKFLAIGAGSINKQGYIVGREEPLDPTCEVVIMDIEGNIQKVMPVPADVKSIAFSADGQRVVAATDNGKVWNWKVDGTLISEINSPNVYDVACSPDNKYFLVIGYSELKLFDLNGVLVKNFTVKTDGYDRSIGGSLCSFSPDGNYILTCNGAEIFVWSVNGNLVFKIPAFDSAQIWSALKMKPEGDLFYSGRELWSMAGRRITLPLAPFGCVFSDDMKYVASADKDGSTILAVDGSKTFRIPGTTVDRFTSTGIISKPRNWKSLKTARYDYNGKFVDSVVAKSPERYSPDGKFFFVSAYNRLDLFDSSRKKIQIFYNSDSAAIGIYDREPYEINGGFFSPDSKVFARNLKKGIALHELPSGKQIAELPTVSYLSTGYEINDGAFGNGMGSGKNKKLFFSKDSKRVYILGFFRLYAYDLKGQKVFEGPELSEAKGQFPEMVVSNDESYLICYAGNKRLYRISIQTGQILSASRELEATVSTMIFTPNGKLLLTKDDNGAVRLWNSESLQEVARFYGLGDSDYAIVTPDGYYTASKNAGRYMHFSKELKTFTFDNFDLIYNRPDIIVKRLGYGSDEMVDGLKNAYLKRLTKMGFTEEQVSLDVHLPEIEVVTKNIPPITESKFLTTQLKVSDSKYLLDRINVYVNEIPLFGSKGLSVKELKTSTLTKEVKVELVNGRNLIQYAVMNEKGAESIKETVEIQYTGPEVKPVLYALTIGVSDYTDNAFDLKYAAKDATDLATLLATNKNGNFAEVKVLKIVDVAATKETIKNAKAFLNGSRVDDQVVLFVAGHGLLDNDMNFFFATSNVDFNNPGALGLPYEDLEGLLDGIPARKKLMLIDACHSGEVDKDETVLTNATAKTNGGTVASRGFKNVARKESVGLKSSFELMQELFTDLRRGPGAVVISSASGVEFAFESDVWKNGVFTYSMLEGLKTGTADNNRDGTVEVSELRDYVIKKVGELTNGKQHPTSRKENLEFNFKVW